MRRQTIMSLDLPLHYRVYGVMFDSASGDYPNDSLLNAYYYNGLDAHKPYTVGAGKVWIDVLANSPHACSWLDVESGDAKPEDVNVWLHTRNQPGNQGIYCSLDTVPAVNEAAAGQPYNLWVATLDGNPFPIIPEVSGLLVAVQAIPAQMLGFNADMSVIVNESYWNYHSAPVT
jgi:hypothetical protein